MKNIKIENYTNIPIKVSVTEFDDEFKIVIEDAKRLIYSQEQMGATCKSHLQASEQGENGVDGKSLIIKPLEAEYSPTHTPDTHNSPIKDLIDKDYIINKFQEDKKRQEDFEKNELPSRRPPKFNTQKGRMEKQ